MTAKDYEYGEGNGFKLGGGQMKGAHVLKNSISFDNHAKGITSNAALTVRLLTVFLTTTHWITVHTM